MPFPSPGDLPNPGIDPRSPALQAYLVAQMVQSACDAGDLGLISGLGRSLGEGSGNPLQYSCLENPMDGAAWWSTVHQVNKESDKSERLSLHNLEV